MRIQYPLCVEIYVFTIFIRFSPHVVSFHQNKKVCAQRSVDGIFYTDIRFELDTGKRAESNTCTPKTIYVISFNSRCEIDLMLSEKRANKKNTRRRCVRWRTVKKKNVNRIGCSLAGKSIQDAMWHITSANQQSTLIHFDGVPRKKLMANCRFDSYFSRLHVMCHS